MTMRGDWGDWEDLWRTKRTAPAALDAMIERTRRARRALWFMRCFSAVVALIALAVVAAALRHAGNRLEIALGVAVGVGIVAVWLMDVVNQRDATLKVEAPAEEYLATRRALCVRQIRFARLGWIVTGLDLVFLIPWWIGGIGVHGAGFHRAQLLTMWLPVAVMGGFAWVIVRLRDRALAELKRLSS